jgi:hypothetical protein
MPQTATDVLATLSTFADDCRRRYHPDPEPARTLLNPFQYAAIEHAVESGTAPGWLTAEWHAGAFVRANTTDRR